MSLDLLEIPAVIEWLDQFGTADRYVAIRLLRTLKYVSFNEFESYLQESLTNLVDELTAKAGGKRLVSIFPVDKATVTKFNTEKEQKPSNDSAGRIAHALNNFQRQTGHRIELTPRKISMQESKVRNIIYVDDFIGSGKRFIDYWRESVPGYIKSWASKGLCKVWVVVYVAHLKGIKKIIHNIGCLNNESFITHNVIANSPLLENDIFKGVLNEYGARTSKKAASLGYSKIATPYIFQHGCPNNAPAILWASGRNTPKGVITTSEGRWDALFPERGIPSNLYPIFESELRLKELPELLWSAGQYRLALSFLDKIDYPKKSPEIFITLTILALMSTGKSMDFIRNNLLMTESQFEVEIKKLLSFQLCDLSYKITSFGKDVLERSKKAPVQKSIVGGYEMFYPSTFMGFQREV